MEIRNWEEMKASIVLLHNCGYDNSDISEILGLDKLYIYGILLNECGIIGWEGKEKYNGK
jgi:hypothetical protein